MIKIGDYGIILEDYPSCADLKRGDIVKVVAEDVDWVTVKLVTSSKTNYDDCEWYVEKDVIELCEEVEDGDVLDIGTKVVAVQEVLSSGENVAIGTRGRVVDHFRNNVIEFNGYYGRWKPSLSKIRVIPDLDATTLDVNTINNNTNENKGSDVDMMTIGTRVMAVVNSRVGVYEAGDIGTVTKYREDADGATMGVLFDHKDRVTFVKPANFTTRFDDYDEDDLITVDATVTCGCGHCTCGTTSDDGDQVFIINDGNGYNAGEAGVKIADVRGGILVDFADDDGKPVYVLDGDFMYGLPAPIVTPYGVIKFYNLSSLSTKGWRFDDNGVLRHPDFTQNMYGSMLNLIDGTFDAVTKESEGDDNIVITVDGNEYIIAKALKGVLFKDVK